MKVWISLCLIWLMVRVVNAASPVTTTPIDDNHLGVFGYSKVQLSISALEKVDINQVPGDVLGEKVSLLISQYPTFESFLRGPLRFQNLTIPEPKVSLTPKERRVYEVLAQATLYPETKALSEIIEAFRTKVESDGHIINLSERAPLQRECFKVGDYSLRCLYERAVEPKVQQLVGQSLGGEFSPHNQAIDIVSKEILKLILKRSSFLVMNHDSVMADSSHHWVARQSQVKLLLKCIQYPESFYVHELISQTRCRKALEEHLVKSSLEKKAQSEIIEILFNPYGPFKRLVMSLSEELLNKGVLCFSTDSYSCKYKRLNKRFDDWSQRGLFNSRERLLLIQGLSKNWIE